MSEVYRISNQAVLPSTGILILPMLYEYTCIYKMIRVYMIQIIYSFFTYINKLVIPPKILMFKDPFVHNLPI